MRLDDERERGNVDEDTTIVNDGEYVGYAEVSFGSWTIEFERAAKIANNFQGLEHDERVTISGPFIGDKDEVEKEVTVGAWQTVIVSIDTWDHIETADDEAFDIGGRS